MNHQFSDMTHEDRLKAICTYSNKLISVSKDLDPHTATQIMLELGHLLMYAQNNLELHSLELGLNYHRINKHP
jgi:hypothetical protein